jgi:methyl-accepting chemotaxis protein
MAGSIGETVTRSTNMINVMANIQGAIGQLNSIVLEIDGATKEQKHGVEENIQVIRELVTITGEIMNNLDIQKNQNHELMRQNSELDQAMQGMVQAGEKQLSYFHDLTMRFTRFNEYFMHVEQSLSLLVQKFNSLQLIEKGDKLVS